jgi:hypothetical protein
MNNATSRAVSRRAAGHMRGLISRFSSAIFARLPTASLNHDQRFDLASADRWR